MISIYYTIKDNVLLPHIKEDTVFVFMVISIGLQAFIITKDVYVNSM